MRVEVPSFLTKYQFLLNFNLGCIDIDLQLFNCLYLLKCNNITSIVVILPTDVTDMSLC